MKKRSLISIFLIFFLSSQIFSQVINDSQIIKTDHWIYRKLGLLAKEEKNMIFDENSMLSVAELKFYFNQIEYDNLSDSGKTVYVAVKDFLYTNSNIITPINKLFGTEVLNDSAFIFDTNLILNPELYYKSNEYIPWSFHYYYKDNLATVPLRFGFSNYVAIENDLFIGKSYYGSSLSDSFCNVPYRDSDMEFLFNRFGYGSVSKAFDNWGVNFQVGKEGLRIGNTALNSIIYDSSFETDCYVQFNLFSKSAKYSLDVTQVDYNKYLYLHQLEFIFFNQLKFGILEGSQVCQPFQLRFLNPFLFMHQMSGWNDYVSENSVYGEEDFCAYFCWLVEWMPTKNSKIYVLYSQNEIQPESEQSTKKGMLFPDSLGVQAGVDVSIPSKYDGYWNLQLEGVYTSPYLYFKQTPEASLYRTRNDNLHSKSDKPETWVKSWIGSPFGPDSIGGTFNFCFEKNNRWNVNLKYLFCMKGENDFSTLEKKTKDNMYYNYYPTVKYEIENKDSEYDFNKEKENARNMWPSGTVTYTNQFGINGGYIINNHLRTDGQLLYSIVNNGGPARNQFEHGIELSISMTYNLF